MSNPDGEKLNRDEFRKFSCILIVNTRNLSQVQKVLRAYKSNENVDLRTFQNAKKWFFHYSLFMSRIEKNCCMMMFSDPSYYLENEIDLILWKNRFYRPIEIERSALSHLSKPYSPADIKPLLSIIGEGIEYYTQIIKKLKHTSTVECFSYQVENNFIAGDGTSCFSKHTKVLLSYHLIIHLGDLYRYQSLVLPPPSDGSSLFKDAEMMYKQAIALDPSNGLGHHQLAVLSTYEDANCMAMYRYCRSLACAVPYGNAQRNLSILLSKNEKLYFQEKERNLSELNKKQLVNVWHGWFVLFVSSLSPSSLRYRSC